MWCIRTQNKITLQLLLTTYNDLCSIPLVSPLCSPSPFWDGVVFPFSSLLVLFPVVVFAVVGACGVVLRVVGLVLFAEPSEATSVYKIVQYLISNSHVKTIIHK